MANPSANIKITAEDRASRVIANVRQELIGLSGVGGKLGALLGPLGGIAGAAAALGSGVYAIQQFVSGIDDLADTAEGLGTTAVALAELRSKAAEAGVESSVLDTALAKLNNKIGDAVAGNEKAVATFKAMGVAFADAAGNARPTEQVLGDIADRMRTYANTAEKAALTSELFGEKVGRRLGAYLNQGSEGLRQFTGLTEDTVREAGKLQVEIDKLANSWERLKNTVLGAAVPAINKLIEAFGKGTLAEQIAQVEQELRGLEQRGYGNPTYVQNLRAELARLKGELRDEDLQRFFAGGNAARRADIPSIAPRLPADTAAAGKASRAVAELNREIDDYARKLAREQASLAEWMGLREIREAEEAFRAAQREIERINDLTGRNAAKQWAEDLALIDDAFFAGRISAEEYDVALRKITGTTQALAEETKKVDDFAKDLGLTFSSAFEDAIINANKLSDVLRGLEQDLLRIITRKLVTEPLANWAGGMFGGSGGGGGFEAFGDLFIKLFGMASGGSVVGGRPYLIGEQGPELFVPGASGSIVPNHRLGGGTTINISVPSGTSRDTASQIAAAVGRQMALTQARAF